MKNKPITMDISISIFVSELNSLLENETFRHCFYDFPRVEIRQKNALYEILEKIKIYETQKHTHIYNKTEDCNYIMKQFCEEISHNLTLYRVTSISNIVCGKTYKKYNGNILLQLNNGFYYSFTVVCCKKDIESNK